MRPRLSLVICLGFLSFVPGVAWGKKHKHVQGTMVTSVDVKAQKINLTDEDNKQSIEYQIAPGATPSYPALVD